MRRTQRHRRMQEKRRARNPFGGRPEEAMNKPEPLVGILRVLMVEADDILHTTYYSQDSDRAKLDRALDMVLGLKNLIAEALLVYDPVKKPGA